MTRKGQQDFGSCQLAPTIPSRLLKWNQEHLMCIQKFEVVPVSAAFGTVGRGKGNMWESSLVLISFKQRKTMW